MAMLSIMKKLKFQMKMHMLGLELIQVVLKGCSS